MNRPGIGLLEAVVALAVLSLAGVAAMAGAAGEARAAHRTRRHLEAAILADFRMEHARLLTRQQILDLYAQSEHGAFETPFNEYTWTLSAEPVADVPGITEVRVTVHHREIDAQLVTRVRPARAEPE